jgi:hypothetical protein
VFGLASVCVTLGVGAFVLVLLGVVYIPAIMGADVCSAPVDALAQILGAAPGVPPLAAASVEFYSRCAADAALPPAGAAAQVASAQAQLDDAAAQLAAFAALGPPFPDPGIDPLLADAAAALGGANATLRAVTAALSCAPSAAAWALVLSGVCSGAVFGLASVCVTLGVGAFVLVLLLGTTAHLILHHPGDLRAEYDAEVPGSEDAQRRLKDGLRNPAAQRRDLHAELATAPPPPANDVISRALRSFAAADDHLSKNPLRPQLTTGYGAVPDYR